MKYASLATEASALRLVRPSDGQPASPITIVLSGNSSWTSLNACSRNVIESLVDTPSQYGSRWTDTTSTYCPISGVSSQVDHGSAVVTLMRVGSASRTRLM